jgi:hypothetical protein
VVQNDDTHLSLGEKTDEMISDMTRTIVHQEHSSFLSEFFQNPGFSEMMSEDRLNAINKNFRFNVRLRIRPQDEIRTESKTVFLRLLTDRRRGLRRDYIRNERFSSSKDTTTHRNIFHCPKYSMMYRLTSTVIGTITFFVLRSS